MLINFKNFFSINHEVLMLKLLLFVCVEFLVVLCFEVKYLSELMYLMSDDCVAWVRFCVLKLPCNYCYFRGLRVLEPPNVYRM